MNLKNLWLAVVVSMFGGEVEFKGLKLKCLEWWGLVVGSFLTLEGKEMN